MSRPNGVFKTENGYQQLIDPALYEKTPKAVFAALVVSFLLNHQNVNQSNIDLDIKREWATLHENGIIPQKPPKQ